MHLLVHPKYRFWRYQIEKLLHIGQPAPHVLAEAERRSNAALAMLSLCPTAHAAQEEARSLAFFSQFDKCVHSPEAFPVRNWEMDHHYALAWTFKQHDSGR